MNELLRRLDELAKLLYGASSEVEWIRAKIGGTFAEESQARAVVEGRVARLEQNVNDIAGLLRQVKIAGDARLERLEVILERVEKIPFFKGMMSTNEKAREPEKRSETKAPPSGSPDPREATIQVPPGTFPPGAIVTPPGGGLL